LPTVITSAVGAGGTGDAVASPSKHFLGKIILIWANLVEFGRNMGKIETKFGQKLFGQNQNLASEKNI